MQRETELSPSEGEGTPLKTPDETSSRDEPSASESSAIPQGRRESEYPRRIRWYHKLSPLSSSRPTQEVSDHRIERAVLIQITPPPPPYH